MKRKNFNLSLIHFKVRIRQRKLKKMGSSSSKNLTLIHLNKMIILSKRKIKMMLIKKWISQSLISINLKKKIIKKKWKQKKQTRNLIIILSKKNRNKWKINKILKFFKKSSIWILLKKKIIKKTSNKMQIKKQKRINFNF